MEWKPVIQRDEGAVVIPPRWLYLHYYEALNILFRIENALRVFVYVVLKNEYKEKWANCAISTAEDENTTISAAAAKRITQAQGFGYLGYDISSPLPYLNSGELVRLITSDTHWSLFKPYFKGKRDVIRTKLDEVSSVRNSLAHFRPIKKDDVDLIKQNIRHAFAGIEECLEDMTRAFQVVPTNTPDDWYKELSTIGSPLVTLRLFQSKSGNWMRVELKYPCPILQTYPIGTDYRTFTIANLMTPKIVSLHKDMSKHCTYITEYLYAGMQQGDQGYFAKEISIFFRNHSIHEHYKLIASELRSLLSRVETETELIKSDNLARGQLIETATTTASLRTTGSTKWWSVNTDSIKCQFGGDDPAEYWGDVTVIASDFIASTTKYPWMPSDISEDDFF